MAEKGAKNFFLPVYDYPLFYMTPAMMAKCLCVYYDMGLLQLTLNFSFKRQRVDVRDCILAALITADWKLRGTYGPPKMSLITFKGRQESYTAGTNTFFTSVMRSMHAGVHVINEHGKLQGHPWRRCRKSNSDFAQAGECGNDTLALWNW
ncbi:hypothetical protein P5673_014982 [Acropora cervicornis]|uniref:Uncharacterized protein n=1 Tax=Acropora cervicornis TaxID=6130 RepID=A0AAD9V5U5_ACRCE|nr:hypothetical protein P5673_014982 [Acropora cervicornis]